jgi:hypothetical protein
LANLSWLEGFDHAVLLCHAANPFVAFDTHAFTLILWTRLYEPRKFGQGSCP